MGRRDNHNRARWIGVATALTTLACASPAAADVRLTLEATSVGGTHALRVSASAARGDLGARLPRSVVTLVRRAETFSSGLGRVGLHVHSDAFVFSSSGRAGAVLRAWRARHRGGVVTIASGGAVSAARTRGGATATVVWRRGARLGVLVVSLASRGATVSAVRSLAVADALLADGWLGSPLPSTQWDRVLAQVRPDGSVSEATALQAFVAVYGPLPGVRTPPGRRTVVPSGTLAANWVLRYASRLTAAQRAVVQRRLGVALATTTAHAADFDDPGFHQDTQLTNTANAFAGTFAAKLGHTLSTTIVAGNTSTVIKGEYADTQALNILGQPGPGKQRICRIRVVPAGQAASATFRTLFMAHEVFHCFQFDIAGYSLPPGWITEGTADWAALTVDPVSFAIGGGNLKTYIATPRTPLFTRSTDAVGFWGHAEDSIPGLWSRLTGILLSGQDSAKAYALAGGAATDFLDSWGAACSACSARVPPGRCTARSSRRTSRS